MYIHMYIYILKAHNNWLMVYKKKYEFVNGVGMTSHIYEMEHKIHVPNHQPG